MRCASGAAGRGLTAPIRGRDGRLELPRGCRCFPLRLPCFPCYTSPSRWPGRSSRTDSAGSEKKKHYSPESCVRGDVYRSHLMLPCALGLPAVALTHIGLLHCPAVVKAPTAATLVAVAERQAGLAAPLHHPGSIRYRRRHHRRRSPRNRSRRSPCHRPGDCRPSSSSRC